jgi:hypothetical protein
MQGFWNGTDLPRNGDLSRLGFAVAFVSLAWLGQPFLLSAFGPATEISRRLQRP